ncbi:hypothetical protein [Roseomonas marmotae]|uniref:Glycosyltransferase family 2 protein n=1 Tax=Roseomonas marmotae TaxID=2768161 RepID=A0ABS3KAL3_9PROT|nr:hypothetical protein [Roseomonas marmotae]MBO1073401.1 hypothetical protein [Roseomonas marmotae]QTI80401.1 hypothetical protein IAI58_06570 [Roseomonas marmotae]
MTQPYRVQAPIILFSFNRPHYLDQVCAGLAAQKGVVLDQRRIWLLQDGAVSALSGRRHARDEDIAESIAVFRRHFPQGRVMASDGNLGVARNILRGERLVFEALEQDLGYFFEDDLLPGPWYVWALERLREQTEPFPRVAYFGAYGDHRRNYPGPQVSYIPLEHHWGFGLRRHGWLKMMEWLKPYYALLEGQDYQRRDHARIFRLYEPLVVGTEASSQDAAKSLACMELNLTRVMTNVSFGRYIGEEGHSFSPTHFRAMGFDCHTIAAGDDFRFEPMTLEKLLWVDGFHRRHYERLKRERFQAVLDAHPLRD